MPLHFFLRLSFFLFLHPSDENIVDGDVDDLDEEPDEAHDQEPNSRGTGNLSELLTIGLVALHHQMLRIPVELCEGFQEDTVHV